MHRCHNCGRACLCGAVGRCWCPLTPEPDGCLAAAPPGTAAELAPGLYLDLLGDDHVDRREE